MRAGATRIHVWREAAAARSSGVASDFGAIVRSDRLAEVLARIAGLGGAVIAALADRELRGYATLVPSSALSGERWEHLPHTFELGSMEVARSSRGRGIATALLAHLGATLPVDGLLLFARGFVGHWDTDVSRLSPVDHRRMLLRMLGRVGFQRWDTDDPEVTDHPLNFLAVRAGTDAPSASLAALAGRVSTSGRDPWW